MGFRPTPEIRRQLEEAARRNQRSLSQEIESRLEQSFSAHPLYQVNRPDDAMFLTLLVLVIKWIKGATGAKSIWTNEKALPEFKVALTEFLDRVHQSVTNTSRREVRRGRAGVGMRSGHTMADMFIPAVNAMHGRFANPELVQKDFGSTEEAARQLYGQHLQDEKK